MEMNFLLDPSNSHNCEECPFSNCGEHCGQQNCWVDVHIARAEELEEEWEEE